MSKLPAWVRHFRPAAPALLFASLLRATVFVVVCYFPTWVFTNLMTPVVDPLVASAASLAVAVLITTAFMMRLYEMRPFYMVGLFVNRAGALHLGVGLGLGAGASLLIVLTQWAAGWARFERGPAAPDWLATFGFGLLILLVGSTGEELLFRGYGFQHLIRAFGPWIAILATAGLFGWAHTTNPSFTSLSLVNTALFGAVFGYAYWRTRDLWLPLGMHLSWNFCLAAIGANVSGFKIKLTALSVLSVGPPLWTGGDYGPEASLLTTLVLLATGIFLWKAPLRQQREGLLAAEQGGRA